MVNMDGIDYLYLKNFNYNKPFVRSKKERLQNEPINFNENINKAFEKKVSTFVYRLKKYYVTIKNQLNSYDFVFGTNKYGDEFFYNNSRLFRLTIFDRSVRLYFYLDSETLNKLNYDFSLFTDINYLMDIPIMLKINNDESLHKAINIINIVTTNYYIKKKKNSFIDSLDHYNQSTKRMIIKNGLTDYLVDKCTLKECENVDDDTILKCLLTEMDVGEVDNTLVECVSIGELSKAFVNPYVITIDLLKEVGIISKKATALKITDGGICERSLDIRANYYDINALKMIILTGGNAVKII